MADSQTLVNADANLVTLDEVVTSEASTTVNRKGVEILTIKGIQEAATTGNPAVGAAQEALNYKNDAQLYAEAAATNADWVYATVSDGEAARVDGDYFWVVSADDSEVLELWRMGATTATDTGKRTINEGFTPKYGERASLVLPNGYTIWSWSPNIDTTNQTLEFFKDTAIMWRGKDYSLQNSDFPATVDLSLTASTVKKVYFNTSNNQFIVKGYGQFLKASDAATSPLLVTIRLSGGTTSSDFSCPYRINGRLLYAPHVSGEQISVITGSASTLFPNLKNSSEVLEFPVDTIFIWRDKYKILLDGASVDLSTIGSTARKVYYSFDDDSFLVKGYSQKLTTEESYKYVLLTAIRSDSSATTSPPTPVLTLSCPYTIDGKLFGQVDTTTQNPLNAMVRGVAHRGYSSVAPENTLPAYRLAKEKGFSYVESDIEWTSDNVPVLLHDSTIDRTSDGTGDIGSMTLATAKTYDYGSWKSAEYAGTEIPTLAEFLTLCKKLSLHPYLELKGSVNATQAAISAEIIKKSGMVNDVTIISFSFSALQAMLAEIPSVRVGYVGSISSSFISTTATLKTADNEVFIDSSYSAITQELVEEALLADLPVEVWTVNGSSDVVPLVEKGVSGITTDALNINEILIESEM